jgi:hypothetical protein
MKTEFNDWWNKDLLTEDNPFEEGTPAYWAWEGWSAGVKAEREACVKLADDSDHVVDGRGYYDQLGDANATARNIAAAIRARGRDAA